MPRSFFKFFSFFIFNLFFLGGNSTAQSIQNNVRIAYISTQPLAVVQARAKAIQTEIDRRWPKDTNKPALEFDIHRFELSPNMMNPRPELALKNRETMDLVMRNRPAIIYAAGGDAAMLAKEYTKQIPIVFGCTCNPGPSALWRLVLNLCTPEGNVTGFTRYDVRVIAPTSISACDPSTNPKSVKLDSLFSKRIEILRDSKEPAIQRVAIIYGEEFNEDNWQYDAKAKVLGVSLVRVKLTDETIDDLPRLMQQAKAEAGLVLSDSLLDRFPGALIRVTSAIPLPILFPRDEADSGAWMHYGTKVDLAARAADYFIPILQGKKISELPVGFPTEYELVVNHALAQRHGWVFPKRFLMLPQREAGAN